MCDHNCSECKTPCALINIAPTLNGVVNNKTETKTEGKQKMSLGSCNSGPEEKIARLDERTQKAIETGQNYKSIPWLVFGIFILNIVLIFVLVICFQSQLTNIRLDIRDSQKDVAAIKGDITEVRILSIDAQRGYSNARKALSRIRQATQDE